jgi:hypothetical protein
MKKLCRPLALALGVFFTVAALSACSEPSAPERVATRICYDNLGGGYLSAEASETVVKGVKTVYAFHKDGTAASRNEIASYDAKSGKFTAQGEGYLLYELKNGAYGRVEVVPAYITDPNYRYTGDIGTDSGKISGQKLLGETHDPSFVETTDMGASTYWLFSTGWANGNDVHSSKDGISWKYEGKTTHAGDFSNGAVIPQQLKDWMNAKNNTGNIQWWAPDVVPAHGGGYWLYTCTVMSDSVIAGTRHESANEKFTPSTTYSQAAIVLYHIDEIAGKDWNRDSFTYKGVLMQSAIPQNNVYGNIDVNSIDPQIVYGEDGSMYMSYGSFGMGNWLLELDPETGLRKDGVYADGNFKDWEEIRRQRNLAVSGNAEDIGSSVPAENKYYRDFLDGKEVKTDFYGRLISLGAMEAPVIARHDRVTVSDETDEYDASGNPVNAESKSYYYSMHSYNWLAGAYQMWGGRSESVWGSYRSAAEGLVVNVNAGDPANQGNKYMGAFQWRAASKVAGCKEYSVVLPGHNDLYTANNGMHLAAYIARTDRGNAQFMTQIHQYYLNSLGDVCINPNRYGGEIDRAVSEEELFAYTDGGRFEMVVLTNSNDAAVSSGSATIYNESAEVTLDRASHEIKKNGAKIGTWQTYGKGYIKFVFDETLKGSRGYDSGETVYYGVVRPAWLGNRDQSGFTITCLGHTAGNRQNMAMFMNNYSTIE